MQPPKLQPHSKLLLLVVVINGDGSSQRPTRFPRSFGEAVALVVTRRVLTQKKLHCQESFFLDVLPVADKCWKAIPPAPKMPETDTMNYRAVLDLDGTAWSERFARLLCYNSVVIRIEVDNDLEEYFISMARSCNPTFTACRRPSRTTIFSLIVICFCSWWWGCNENNNDETVWWG